MSCCWNSIDCARQAGKICQSALIVPARTDGLGETSLQRTRLRETADLKNDAPVAELIAKAYALLQEAPCRILIAALDDALAVEERPNMPATIDEWPNWSIALPKTLEEIEKEPLTHEIAKALRR